jgi:hypothetical protein
VNAPNPRTPKPDDLVLYTLRMGPNVGQVRDALVTSVDAGSEFNTCSGTVFLEEGGDEGAEATFTCAKFDDPSVVALRFSAGYGMKGHRPGTWHWPPENGA